MPNHATRGNLSAKQVQRLLKVSSSVLQQWLARDLIPFETVTAGKRIWRRFNADDLPRLIVMAELLAQGLPIGDVISNVDTILEWNYKRGVQPGVILWFRQINLLFFSVREQPLERILRERDCASCILLSLDELKRKIDAALAELSRVGSPRDAS